MDLHPHPEFLSTALSQTPLLEKSLLHQPLEHTATHHNITTPHHLGQPPCHQSLIKQAAICSIFVVPCHCCFLPSQFLFLPFLSPHSLGIFSPVNTIPYRCLFHVFYCDDDGTDGLNLLKMRVEKRGEADVNVGKDGDGV